MIWFLHSKYSLSGTSSTQHLTFFACHSVSALNDSFQNTPELQMPGTFLLREQLLLLKSDAPRSFHHSIVQNCIYCRERNIWNVKLCKLCPSSTHSNEMKTHVSQHSISSMGKCINNAKDKIKCSE